MRNPNAISPRKIESRMHIDPHAAMNDCFSPVLMQKGGLVLEVRFGMAAQKRPSKDSYLRPEIDCRERSSTRLTPVTLRSLLGQYTLPRFECQS
jgi:hypothetical protein